MEGIRDWSKENPLSAGVGLWAIFMVGTGIYLKNKKMKPSLKIIHARMVAQGAVIAGICAAGIMGALLQDTKKGPTISNLQIRELKPVDHHHHEHEHVAVATASDAAKETTERA